MTPQFAAWAAALVRQAPTPPPAPVQPVPKPAPPAAPLGETTASIIAKLTDRGDFPRILRWEIGTTETGLPLLSGELAADVAAAERILESLAQDGGHRYLNCSDPARLSAEWTWPEAGHGQTRPTPRAVIQLWAPTATPVRYTGEVA